MADPDDALRHHAANAAAKDLGYRIDVELDPVANIHTAFAYRVDDEKDPPVGCFLYRSRDALEAHEVGLELLRGIEERGDPWPVAPDD